MENASKALIIAGSILLSILIIALGMYIFTQSSSSGSMTQLSETEVTTFNGKVEKYKGDQLGSVVSTLLSVIRSSNAKNNDEGRLIAVTTSRNVLTSGNAGTAGAVTDITTAGTDLDTIADNIDDIDNAISKSHTYTITMSYDATTGLVTGVNIAF